MSQQSWEKYNGSYPVKMELGFELFLKPSCDYSKKRFVYKVAERNEIDFLKGFDFEGLTCFDIGANIGYWSVFLLSKVGASGGVHAFEPSPTTFKILEQNIKHNFSSAPVVLNNLALGEKQGTVSLYMNEHHSGDDRTIFTEGRKEVKVKQITVDEYVSEQRLNRLDFVKIDVQGAELGVFKGAIKSLEKFSPAVLMEWTPSEFNHGDSFFKEFFEISETLGWKFFSVEDGRVVHRDLLKDPSQFSGNILIETDKSRLQFSTLVKSK